MVILSYTPLVYSGPMEFDPDLFAFMVGLTTILGCVVLGIEIQWRRRVEQRLAALEKTPAEKPV